MRKLLNTLFVTSEDAYLALENENVVIYKGEEKAAQYPLKLFESLLSFSYKGASPALMGACVRNGIGLTFLTPSGRMLARVVGESQGNVRLRKEQYRVSDNPEASCRAARNFIFGKVHNSRWVLERTLRDHALRVKADELRAASAHLQEQRRRRMRCSRRSRRRRSPPPVWASASSCAAWRARSPPATSACGMK